MTDTMPMPGTVFADRYEIVKQLGEGAFGAVFEARMQPMMRRVALKVLHPEVAGHSQLVARFVREARILGELEHPHVVSVVDVGLSGGVPFLVMELLNGETLGARIRRGPIPMAEAMALFLPVCAAVQAIHDQNIVHRDLKPENIMLARQATGHLVPKILDFGIAKSEGRDGVGTRTQTVMGTAHYMSPEQATDSKNIDGRSDQWALAVILWEMLTGKKLFQGAHQVAILSAVLSAPIPPIEHLVPGVTPAFAAALVRVLNREPEQRFASVSEFASRLLPMADAATQSQWASVFSTPMEDTEERPPSDLGRAHSQTSLPGEAPVPPSLAMDATHPASGSSSPPESAEPIIATLPGTLQPAVNTLRGTRSTRSPRSTIVAVGGLIALASIGAIGFAIRGSNAPTSSPAAATRPNFSVGVRTEPATAQIDLDGRFVATGSLAREFARDGQTHTLRIYADGYEPQVMMFADAAPANRVTLRRLIAEPAHAPSPLLRPKPLPGTTDAAPRLPLARPAVAPVAVPTAPPLVHVAGQDDLRNGRRGRSPVRRADDPQGFPAPTGFSPPAPLPAPAVTPSNTATGTNNVGII